MSIPVPEQRIKDFEQLGLGMFVHFGMYSQLKRGEWAYFNHQLDKEKYLHLQDTFNPGSMAEIVETAKIAGCKYICLTTRHHEGFSLYDTKGLNTYDAPHSPAGRDLVAEFVDECRKADIVPFFYHTTLDWMHPDFEGDFPKYLEYLRQSVKLLCTNYGKIGGLWFDGNWSRPDADWEEEKLYALIRKYQPDAMIINNTGLSNRGELGKYEIDAVTYERGMPTPIDREGAEKYVAGEMCETMNEHWGIADDIEYKSVPQIIREICACRKVGANMLLNIGPNADASVPLMARAIMECVGRFMEPYGRAIYNGRPLWSKPGVDDFILRDVNDPKTAYIFCFAPGTRGGDPHVAPEYSPVGAFRFDGFFEKVKSIRWMENGEEIAFSNTPEGLSLNYTGFSYGTRLVVRVAQVTLE